MPLISNIRYRPEIDGLRAIAILAVVFYHAGLGVPGGYVGVNVFFVVSGFLITSQIFKNLQEGRFSLAQFWERRARRIVPTLVIVVVATLVAGWFLLLPSDYVKLGQSAAWQAVFASNFYFWRNTNYFAGPAEEQPLLHTWFLAVSEQFYLVLPVLLLVLFRFPRLRSRGRLLALFGLGFMASLGASIYAVPRMPAAAFYLLPTRAWELLCGAIVAILPAATLRRPWREAFCSVALAAILAPCFLYTKETPFPGLAALPPCLGTALFIWAAAGTIGSDSLGRPTSPASAGGCSSSSHQHPAPAGPAQPDHSRLIVIPPRWGQMGAPGGHALPTIARLLALRPMVFIGLISYSFYLWHWPFFAFTSYWALEPPHPGYRLGMVVVAFLLAVFSWRFVETPFRTRKLGTRREAMFAWAGSGLGLVVACAIAILIAQGIPARFPSKIRALDQAKAEANVESRIAQSTNLSDARAGRFPRLGATGADSVGVLVWGDSHARSILPAVDQLARNHGVVALAAWNSSTPPVVDYVPQAQYSLGKDCPAFGEAVLDHVRSNRIPAVLLAARWSDHFGSGQDEQAIAALVRTIEQVRQAGSTPWILMEVPYHMAPVPKAVLHREVLQTDIRKFADTPKALALRNRSMLSLRPLLEASGARIIDVADVLLDPRAGHYVMDHEAVALYYDDQHLTRAGACFVAPALAPIFPGGEAGQAAGIPHGTTLQHACQQSIGHP